MPAKSAIRPRFSSSLSTATAPACASASTILTPGMIGFAGKVAGAVLLGDELVGDHAPARLQLRDVVEGRNGSR